MDLETLYISPSKNPDNTLLCRTPIISVYLDVSSERGESDQLSPHGNTWIIYAYTPNWQLFLIFK